ncbi:hypothetical protein APHAL10511_002186 [Amanita phalloides]|nr:hypothetical protein APHAL10511_002186 [Amanita phalloides]
MSSDSWPPQLKEWVARCLGQMTDANRAEAQAELKKVISEAFAAQSLWTTDWVGVQLQSLLPKPTPALNNLKRKTTEHQTLSKKAKKAQKQLHNMGPYGGFTTPATPAFDANDQLALERRAARFSVEHGQERKKALQAKMQHAHLFDTKSLLSRSASPYGLDAAAADDPEADPNVIDWDRHTIVGTSQEIFKDYLRLTTDPKPEQIRPYPVLQHTLTELKKKWREKVPYNWICSQFKSLRQDLTIQRIKNEFTVQVYEIHARMALESDDMVEYNQCQATLKTLYELGIPGRVEEFAAYRILMLLHGLNRSELNLYVGQLTPRQKADRAVQHALGVSRALSMGNYHSLFHLYEEAPNMGAYIMDHFINRERVKALLVITKAYHTIPLSFLQTELAFDSLDDVRTFLVDHSAGLFQNPNVPDRKKNLDCRGAHGRLREVFQEKYRRVGIKDGCTYLPCRINDTSVPAEPVLPATQTCPPFAMSSPHFKQAPHKLLAIPGPIEIADDVLYANAHPSMSHVSPEFILIFGECIRMTREVLLTETAQPFLISGSGTLGWDQVSANLVESGDNVLVLHSGYFGDSFAACLETYGANVTQIYAPVGSAVTPSQLEPALSQKRYKAVTITHVDTSTGVLSDVKALTAVVRRVSPHTLVFVDAVCSVASEEIRMDEWDIDVVLTASQKGLGTPPGLSILVASQRALGAYQARKTSVTSYYASWKNWLPIMRAYEDGRAAYFATPPVNLIYAYHISLELILRSKVSLEERLRRHKETTARIREAVEQLGLKYVAQKKEERANGMTALYYPAGVTAGDLLPKLVKRDVVVAGGLHKDIKDKYFRIGHMGISVVDEERHDVDKIIVALREALREITTLKQ